MNAISEKNDISVRYKSLLCLLGILLIVCLYAYRFFLLVNYCFKFVDNDTAIFWHATVDYAHGVFHEPFFYGQSYGLLIESFLTVPLYWMRVPLWIAVPLVSMIVCTLPFIIIAVSAWKRDPLTSVMILLIPCMTGLKYDIVTTIPRSFGGGFLLAIIGSLLLIKHYDGKRLKTQIGHGAGIFLMMMGATTIISSLAISGFAICFVIIRSFFNGKSLKENLRAHKYLGSLIGLLSGSVLFFVFENFYSIHPDYDYYHSLDFSLDISALSDNLSEIKDLFAFFSPSDSLWFVAPALLILIFLFILVFRRKPCRQLSFLLIMCVVGTLLIMTTSKSRDFMPTSFLSSAARLYIFVPYLIAMLLYVSTFYEKRTISAQKSRPFVIAAVPLLILIVLSSSTFKIRYLKDKMAEENNTLTVHDPYLDVVSVDEVRKNADKMKQICSDYDIQYVVYFTTYRTTRAYTCEALNYGTVTTYNATMDRRTWICHELEKQNSEPIKIYAVTDSKEGFITIPAGKSVVQHLEKLGFKR